MAPGKIDKTKEKRIDTHMSAKLNIEQLVSSQIGEAEVNPSPDVWKGVQRKLRWKQFVRFKPGKPNIYYLGGLLTVGAGLVALFNGDALDRVKASESNDNVSSYVEMMPIQENDATPEMQGQISGNTTEAENLQESRMIDADQAGRKQTDASAPDNTRSASEEAEGFADGNRYTDQINEGKSNGQSEDKRDGQSENWNENSSENLNENQNVSQGENQTTLVTYFSSSIQSGCIPLTVKFINQSSNAASSYWTFGTDEQITEESPIYTFQEAGQYSVTLTSEDRFGQASSYRQVIEAYPSPKAEFEVQEGFEGLESHVALNLVNYSKGAMSYSWNLMDKSKVVSASWESNEFQPSINLSDLNQRTEQLRLLVTDKNGCRDTSIQTLPLSVGSSHAKIKYPNAFAPNPMGPSGGTFSPHEKRIDLFHPIFTEVPQEYYLKIYSRRGESIFETNNIYNGWDGYFQQMRSLGGVYVWMVEGIWEDGEEFKLHGDVTLIWKEIW